MCDEFSKVEIYFPRPAKYEYPALTGGQEKIATKGASTNSRTRLPRPPRPARPLPTHKQVRLILSDYSKEPMHQ